MSDNPGKNVASLAREISRGAAMERLPTPALLADQSEGKRQAIQQGLREELFAVSSLLADAVVARARTQRSNYPPYGLVQSRYTEMRVIVDQPEPFPVGSIDGFLSLGKAYMDTTVFHLHGAFGELRREGKGWLIDRLGQQLELFRVGASAATKARMRDAVSFIYGGLQFGTGISVQLAEVMATMLAGDPTLSAEEKAAILTRSSLPAYDLAALSVSGVLAAYQGLQSPTRRSTAGLSAQSWMDPARFSLREVDGRPWRIDLSDADRLGSSSTPPSDLHTFSTLGCPARISPTGGTSPIAALWAWGIELAHDTGLLGFTAGA